MPKRSTKKRSIKIDLIFGEPCRTLGQDHLPSQREVLSFLNYQSKRSKKDLSRCIPEVSEKVASVWRSVGLPTRLNRNIARKIKDLLEKRNGRRRHLSSSKTLEFKKSLEELFDISSSDISHQLNDDASSFWRKQTLSKEPIGFKANNFDPAEQSIEIHENIQQPASDDERSTEDDMQEPASDDVSATDNGKIEADPDYEQPSTSRPPRRSKRINVISDTVVENLDREKISNRGAVGVVGSVAAALGVDIDDFSLSKSTCHRRRKQVS